MTYGNTIGTRLPRQTVSRSVEFLIIDRDATATCEACKVVIKRSADGQYEVSPHLREAHGFGEGEIQFEKTADMICPPMVIIEARQ